MYGLEQTPRVCYNEIEAYFIQKALKNVYVNTHCSQIPKIGDKIWTVNFYVDDLIYIGNDKSIWDEFKNSMKFHVVFEVSCEIIFLSKKVYL